MLSEVSHAIFAWNRTGDASDVTVNVEGGTVHVSRSSIGVASINAVHAFNNGAGDVIVDVADGATLISRVSEAVYANLDSTLALDNQVKITQGGGMMGRTGVYARAGGYSVAAEGEDVAARAEEKPDVIDVTWTGSFSHGTTEAEKAMVAQNDEGRFRPANVSNLVIFAQNIEAKRVTDGLYGSAAGVEAAVMPRRATVNGINIGIVQVVAGSDAPGTIAPGAQMALLAETGDASRRTAILAQFRAMLGNEEIDAATIITAIDSAAKTVADLSDEEIVAYLGADTSAARNNLLNVLYGLSDEEKAVLAAVATGDRTRLDAALDDADAGFTDDYKTAVRALRDRYNPGNIKVAMNGGSIDSRGDGIRAYYATPHDNNGAISVTVAAGTTVTGAVAGIRVANAGLDAGEAGTADDILKQTVTVHGMVTGGTDAAVHLVGGGRLTVGATGKVYAGDGDDSSGRAIWVNDPGRAVIRIDGEVKGGAGAPAAVHLTGGGRVEIGRNGRVKANGATNAILGEKANDDTPATEVLLHVDGAVSRERAAEALKRVEGRIAGDGIDTANGFSFVATDEAGPTGMTMQIPVRIVSGRPDLTTTDRFPMETDLPKVDCSLEGVSCSRLEIRESRAGVLYSYPTPSDGNGAINVTVAAGTTVTGGAEGGIRVANAGLDSVGMDTDWGRALYLQDAERLRQHFVTVRGTVTGGMGPAVHLAGGGALLVGETGRLTAGAGQPAVLVNDPGEAIIVIHGVVKGSEDADAAVHLTGGGKVEISRTGRVEANGATNAILGEKANADTPATEVFLHVDGAVTPESAEEALERLKGKIAGDGINTANGFSYVSYVATDKEGATGMRTMKTVRLVNGRPELPEDDEEDMKMDCGLASDKRCGLYAALPSALLAMNGLPTYEERMSAARDARGGWARVEAARGKWEADSSTQQMADDTSTPLENVAYDHSRSGLRAGMDFAAGDAGRVGVSVHGLRGSAEMAGVGEVDLSGAGLGVQATTALAGGVHVDAQAAVTWYHADLKSAAPARGTLKNDVNGRGYALGVEVGKRLPAMDGGVTVTPRAGLLWSKAGLDDFDEVIVDGARVSVEDAQSLKGRAGVGVEKVLDGAGMDGSRLFGSLDVEQEFKEETEVMVSGTSLKASARKTRIRTAAGAVHVWGEGRYALQSSLGYTAGGGDNREFGAGLSFAMRF